MENIIFCIIIYLWTGFLVGDIFYDELDMSKRCAVALFYPILFLINVIKGLLELL